MVITRQQYIEGQATHEQYYGQYVNETFKQQVAGCFGVERLQEAYKTDTSFNCAIPLYEWEGWYGIMNNRTFRAHLAARGDMLSLNVVICVLKECARQIVVDGFADVTTEGVLQ